MREFINIITESLAGLQALKSQKEKLIRDLQLDHQSAAAVLEMDEDDPDIAEVWFDALLSIYQHIANRGAVPIYRHMMVYDFQDFIEAIQDGSGRLGMHWSINPDIESPTWQQNQKGTVPVAISGMIHASQIDWVATLSQNFEWPHEGEMIFTGPVFVDQIENRDEDTEVKIGRELPR